MSAQTAADLRAAADILRRDGWRQGDYGTVDGCKCAYGALHYVASKGTAVDDAQMDWTDEERANVSADALAANLALGDYSEVPRWNDAPGRTAAEVIAALEAAATAADTAPMNRPQP